MSDTTEKENQRHWEDPTPSAALPTTNTSTKPQPPNAKFRHAVLNISLSVAGYYAARWLGTPSLEALLVSTSLLALGLGYSALKSRAFDPLTFFLLVADLFTLTVGVLTKSPTMTMLGQLLPGVVFELFLIAGVIKNEPITESLVEWVRPGWVEQHVAKHEWTPADARVHHRIHMHLTLVVVILQLLHLLAAVLIIFTLPVDLAKGTMGLLTLVTVIASLTVALSGIARFLRRHNTRQTTQVSASAGPTHGVESLHSWKAHEGGLISRVVSFVDRKL